MFVLPKGTLVHVGGLPFRLLEDSPTDGLEVNYNLAVKEEARVGCGLREDLGPKAYSKLGIPLIP